VALALTLQGRARALGPEGCGPASGQCKNTSKFSKKIPYMVAPQGGKKFVPLQNHMGCVTFGKSLLFRALHDL